MAKSLNRATLVTLVVVAALLGHAAATTYVVGGSRGWTFSPNATVYATWASQYTFTVGDVLVFNFTTGVHTVATVTKESFDTCNTNNPFSLTTIGPANITLASPGEVYFLCTVGQHCVSAFQKLAINVTASSSTPPASPPSVAPTPSPIPETPSPTTTPPAPGPGGPAPTNPAIPPSPTTTLPAPRPGGPAPTNPAIPPPSSTSPPPEDSPSPNSIVPPPPPPPSGAASLGIGSIFSVFVSVGVSVLF